MKLFSFGPLVMLVAMMVLPIITSAQYPAGSYTFTQSSGTYTPITGGTVIASTIPDYMAYPSITLTPGFNFCGVVYTNAFVTSDGLITLGGTTAANTTNGIANGGGSGILLCPFNSDMVGSSASGATPNIRYQLVGDEHVFQWNDISRWPAATDRFSFQARLNHVTGVITYVYSVTSVGTSSSYFPVIGIRTANTAGNWQSRLVGTGAETWATSLAGTATTSVLRFTNAAPAKFPATGQTYVYTPPPACNTSSSLPTSGTIAVSPGTLCLSGNVNMTFTPNVAMPSVTGITYKWQTAAAAAGPYTDIPGAITTVPTYTTTVPVSTSSYFRCVVLCNATTTVLTSSASTQVVINNPGTPTVAGATRCGPGAVTLTATPPSGSTVNWYANAVGGAPLYNGNNFNTGYIPATTTFYAAAASGSSSATPQIGNGTGSQADYEVGGPFNNYYRAEQTQLLYTASEIIAAGGGTGTINSIAFNCTGIPVQSSGNTTLPNYKVYIKTVPSSTTTLTWQADNTFTQVYTNAAFNPVLGWNTYTLSSAFPWDGVTNIVIKICYDQTSPSFSSGTTQGKHQFTTTTGRMMYYNSDGVASGCPQTGTSTSTSLPNVRFGMTLGCTGNRLPVVATVTTPPAVTKTAPAIACNNAVATISVASSPMSNYVNYTWTPVVTDLYTNAAATTPYTTGSSPTVYMKSTAVGQHTYYMYATGATPAACAFADTLSIWVQPDSVYIKAAPDTICISGTTMMKLMPQSGYAPGSIQWQDSPDGTTYTDIGGATNTTFTTPVLTANRFYRAVIKSANTVACQMPVKKIVVANPLLVSKTDSFHCGPGTVVLQATVGANSGIKWYESMTANQPVGGGSPWTTAYLGATDTFYVAASSGTPQPAPTNVVLLGSAGTMSSTLLPLYYNKGHRMQWMITAAEMTAQGFTEGLIKSMGLDITSVNMTYQNISVKMKLTTATSFVNAGVPGAVFATGMDQVYSAASFTPVPNTVNTFNFQSPFYWDGTSSIIIEMCHSNPASGSSANSAQVKYYYNYTYPNNSAIYQYGNVDNICSTPTGGTVNGPYSSYYRPKTIIGMIGACESPRQPVIAYIRPVPEVNLGPDINKCVDEGYAEVLDAGVQANVPQFLWDNGSTSQVRAVTEPGNYYVTVTNEYTCKDSDTINVILRNNPIVNLGNDTTVCNGVVLNLNPGNAGIEYFWNTGQTSQNINVSNPGTYSVFVTNSQGCTKADTIVVNMQGELPTIQGIQVTNNGQYTFHFTAVNPQNVIGYDWDFGDGSPHSYQASPTHTYPNAGNYVVVLHLSSSCGFFSDSSSAHILGINQLNVDNNEMTVYPNPTKESATILNRGALKMESISVYNVLGQIVYKEKADSKDKHTLNLNGMASGVYTIQIFTDKGTVSRKLEIIK